MAGRDVLAPYSILWDVSTRTQACLPTVLPGLLACNDVMSVLVTSQTATGKISATRLEKRGKFQPPVLLLYSGLFHLRFTFAVPSHWSPLLVGVDKLKVEIKPI